MSRWPRSWVRTDDAISEDAVVHGRSLLPGEFLDFTLQNTWTLGPRELEACFSLDPYLAKIDYIFERVFSHES